MKIRKEYEFSHKRQIWRILPAGDDKLIIEERDIQKREVYFNCIEINSGKKILENFQLDEKFWVGIEAVYRDLIFFHKYQKPDMPAHKGIISYDINSGSVLWQNSDYNFLFISGEILYSYKSMFEGKIFYALNYLTGEIINELGSDPSEINRIKENERKEKKENDYIFPETLYESMQTLTKDILKESAYVPGEIQTAGYGDIIFINALEQSAEENKRNIFKAVDISKSKTILSEVINKETGKFIPDSFFIKNNLVFLLKEKDTLVVYSIKQ